MPVSFCPVSCLVLAGTTEPAFSFLEFKDYQIIDENK